MAQFSVITHQFAELSQGFCDFGNVPELHQVLRLEHLRHPVASHLKDDGVDPVQDWVAAPVSVDLFPGHGVEADGDHEPRQDGPVLDPPLEHAGRIRPLLQNVHHPLHDLSFELQIFLNKKTVVRLCDVGIDIMISSDVDQRNSAWVEMGDLALL